MAKNVKNGQNKAQSYVQLMKPVQMDSLPGFGLPICALLIYAPMFTYSM